MKTAIIAGTGIYQLPGITFEPRTIETPYGPALINECKEYQDLFFLARHGLEHHTPPHRINYLANLKALKIIGVERILATNAVGSISKHIPPGAIALISDFLDFSSGRPLTYYEGGKSGLVHTDMSQAYCPALGERILKLAPEFNLDIIPSAVYVATNGPRFETPAEIRMFARLGGDVVGMTGVPEVVLARELNMHYAVVAYSINWAAGIETEMGFISNTMDETIQKISHLLVRALQDKTPLSCNCDKALMVMQPPEE